MGGPDAPTDPDPKKTLVIMGSVVLRKGSVQLLRLDNDGKTRLATNLTLQGVGVHLFGAKGAMSNRKVFGLLLRAVGLGKFGERNGWPIAVARRRFKCGKEESDTDTEAIAGDQCEEGDEDGYNVSTVHF